MIIPYAKPAGSLAVVELSKEEDKEWLPDVQHPNSSQAILHSFVATGTLYLFHREQMPENLIEYVLTPRMEVCGATWIYCLVLAHTSSGRVATVLRLNCHRLSEENRGDVGEVMAACFAATAALIEVEHNGGEPLDRVLLEYEPLIGNWN